MKQENFKCRREEKMIYGKVFLPHTTKDLKIAIVCHGFMANMNTVQHYAKAIADIGYAAFAFDFCGGGISVQSDGLTTTMSIRTEVEDLLAVIQYAQSTMGTNYSSVTLVGCSQGGLVAGLAAARIPDKVTNLVMLYPAFCIPDDARKGRILCAEFDPANVPEAICCGQMTIGKEYVLEAQRTDPFEEIARYPGRCLIIHGTKDTVVPVAYSKQVFDVLLKKRGDTKDIRLIMVKGAMHGFSRQLDKRIIGTIQDWLVCA